MSKPSCTRSEGGFAPAALQRVGSISRDVRNSSQTRPFGSMEGHFTIHGQGQNRCKDYPFGRALGVNPMG